MPTALVTGSSGFIDFFTCERLLDDGFKVIGLDCMTDYYDFSLKERRHSVLLQNKCFRTINKKAETPSVLMDIFASEKPDVDLSRFSAAPSARLRHLAFESDGAFPTQC